MDRVGSSLLVQTVLGVCINFRPASTSLLGGGKRLFFSHTSVKRPQRLTASRWLPMIRPRRSLIFHWDRYPTDVGPCKVKVVHAFTSSGSTRSNVGRPQGKTVSPFGAPSEARLHLSAGEMSVEHPRTTLSPRQVTAPPRDFDSELSSN